MCVGGNGSKRRVRLCAWEAPPDLEVSDQLSARERRALEPRQPLLPQGLHLAGLGPQHGRAPRVQRRAPPRDALEHRLQVRLLHLPRPTRTKLSRGRSSAANEDQPRTERISPLRAEAEAGRRGRAGAGWGGGAPGEWCRGAALRQLAPPPAAPPRLTRGRGRGRGRQGRQGYRGAGAGSAARARCARGKSPIVSRSSASSSPWGGAPARQRPPRRTSCAQGLPGAQRPGRRGRARNLAGTALEIADVGVERRAQLREAARHLRVRAP